MTTKRLKHLRKLNLRVNGIISQGKQRHSCPDGLCERTTVLFGIDQQNFCHIFVQKLVFPEKKYNKTLFEKGQPPFLKI